ncbi:PLP-dependent aminotransferase family protein [Pseudoalteromonas ulvae]|uniref:HTH gntR-type domain-containing protein n=1 Tax=Pseudoalteromonas ulvae TaxID=107327 RepID=A0A244CSY5_PSEDV|nr:PLP-dependent aminotransferase family protein [Pseudoalteromonas ulvae]OUL58727.1 hypothetical protein B1199_00085 [Pseudoalteromonas ulvae]
MTILDTLILDGRQAKYLQVATAIEDAITAGQLSAGEKLPPQRILSYKLGVTVGTITRAYSELERRGCVIAKIGSGTFVKTAQPHPALLTSPCETHFDLRSANAPMLNQIELMQTGLNELSQQTPILAQCLTYQSEIAFESQRTRLATWLSHSNIHCDESQVLFTYGGQHAIQLTLQTLCLAGDTVLCEGLTFAGFSACCQLLQLKAIGLEMDHEGITINSLKAAIKQSHPRALYLTPQVQNPTCVQLSLERRHAIVALCRENNIMIIEDDVQYLAPECKLASFYQLAPEITVYISSFSKTFSGGLRIGYLIAQSSLREKMRLTLKANCWTVPTLQIELICRWLEHDKVTQLADAIALEMKQRHQILEEVLSEFSMITQHSGYNAWLILPPHWRAVDFERFALHNKVLIRAAESFAIGRFPAPQAIRISLCASKNHHELRLALEALKTCLHSQISHHDIAI